MRIRNTLVLALVVVFSSCGGRSPVVTSSGGGATGQTGATGGTGIAGCLIVLYIDGGKTGSNQGAAKCGPGRKVTFAFQNLSPTDSFTVAIDPATDFYQDAAKTMKAQILTPPAAQTVSLGPQDSDNMKFVVAGNVNHPYTYHYTFHVGWANGGKKDVDPDFEVP